MANVTFNGDQKLIIVNSGITEIDAQVDLYSDWKEWVMEGTNAKYAVAFRSAGGDPLGGSVYAGAYYFLQNQTTDGTQGWRIRPYEGNHTLTITGNIYPEDVTKDLFVPTLGSYQVEIITNKSSLTQVVVSGSGVTAQDKLDIAGAVWDEMLASHNTSGAAARALLEIYRLFGLDPTKPLVVTTTSREAGAEIQQTIDENAGTVTVTRQ